MHIWELFLVFFKLGLFTFGGWYAMIPNIKEIIVEKKKWLTMEEVIDLIAIAESTPGPIAINMATFIGYKKGKVLGSLLATFGVVLPSFIIIFLISLFLRNIMDYEYVKYAFMGIKACVCFLILKTGIEMFIKCKHTPLFLIAYIITLLMLFIFKILSISVSSIYFIVFFGILFIIIDKISYTNTFNKKKGKIS